MVHQIQAFHLGIAVSLWKHTFIYDRKLIPNVLLFLVVTTFANKLCSPWQQNIGKRKSTYRSQQFFLSNCWCHSKGVRSSRLNALIKPHVPKWVIFSDSASSVKWIQIPYTLWWTLSDLISLQRSRWNEAE